MKCISLFQTINTQLDRQFNSLDFMFLHEIDTSCETPSQISLNDYTLKTGINIKLSHSYCVCELLVFPCVHDVVYVTLLMHTV